MFDRRGFFGRIAAALGTAAVAKVAVPEAEAVEIKPVTPLPSGEYDDGKTAYFSQMVGARNHTCAWQLGDRACRYKGSAQSCDKSWTNCLELHNQINFGGVPKRNHLADVETTPGYANASDPVIDHVMFEEPIRKTADDELIIKTGSGGVSASIGGLPIKVRSVALPIKKMR